MADQHHPHWQSFAGLFVLLALLLFSATALSLQWLRTDLDWISATLSLYLHGPGGLGLRIAYCVLAAAIAGIALALYLDESPRTRRGLPLALFWVAAAGLCGVAIGDSYLPDAAPLLAPLVHGLSAQTAFLCVSCAMLLQTWQFRGDPRWQQRFRLAWGWAWLTFVCLWIHVGWRVGPRGLGQKLVIAMVLIWLAPVAYALWRMPRAEAVATAYSGDNAGDIHPKESAP